MASRSYGPIKRVLDVLAASIGLVVLSPVLGVAAVLVGLNLGRPVIFKHDRPGLDGKVFTLCKFRSMLEPDAGGKAAPDSVRLTSFGRVLRATSIDELPTLVNVLKGDMSVVGPRPLNVRYLDRYSPEQARRHDVRPGITGLAQASGRNMLSWDQKFALDLEYIANHSFILDARIIGMTLVSVLRRSGISADGHATAPEFTGPDAEAKQ